MQEQRTELVPGPRQTITVIDLPGHGRGRLVWRNGPAFFIPDDGEPFPLYRVTPGGSRTLKPVRLPDPAKGKSVAEMERKNEKALAATMEAAREEKTTFSYERVQILKEGPVQEAEVIERGERHDRYFSSIFGEGWLVWEHGAGWWNRFETEAGEVKLRFQILSLSVGRPAYAKKMARSSKMPPISDPDEMNWSTFETNDGSVLTFRRGGPPPPEGTFIPVRADTYQLLTPKVRKAYDAAKKAHEAAAAGSPPGSPEQLTLPIGS